jgi:predicted HTH domain antitoxin
MENSYNNRRRVNVSTSVKGIVTFDATVELIDCTNEQVVAEIKDLVTKLKAEYPIQTEGK